MINVLLTLATLCHGSFVLKRNDPPKADPGQVHLSYYNKTTRAISWVSFNEQDQYLYVKTPTGQQIFPADTELWIEPQNKTDKRWLHHSAFAVKPGVTYEYYVGDMNTVTDKFTYTTPEVMADDENVELLIYGDMGLENAQTHQLVTKLNQVFNIEMIMHIGDLCYNLYELNGTKTDQWMEFIEPIASSVPYQTIPGNHEWNFNFTHYESRYKWVSEQGNPHYYSYDIGPVHVLAYSTEFFYYDEDKDWGKQRLIDQFNFVKADLARADANRENVPWIITMGHRPMYCSNGNHEGACLTQDTPHRNGTVNGQLVGLEGLFNQYNVDVCFAGHEHSYERTLPVYQYKYSPASDNELFVNPEYPIHVITGAAGNREKLASFVDPQEGNKVYAINFR